MSSRVLTSTENLKILQQKKKEKEDLAREWAEREKLKRKSFKEGRLKGRKQSLRKGNNRLESDVFGNIHVHIHTCTCTVNLSLVIVLQKLLQGCHIAQLQRLKFMTVCKFVNLAFPTHLFKFANGAITILSKHACKLEAEYTYTVN